jgi:type I restriction enzyme, R subunit
MKLNRSLLAMSSLPESQESNLEWKIDLDHEYAEKLHHLLLVSDLVNASLPVGHIGLQVDRFRGLKVEIFANEHPPPHFRVICAAGSANFRISDCFQINGGLKREYRLIKRWHSENKLRLVSAWNERRPSDCPVGEYRDE